MVRYKRRPSEGHSNDSCTRNFGSSSRMRILLLCHCTAPLKMNLGVNENIMIDSIDELH